MRTTEPVEVEWVRRAQGGEVEAFAELVRAYQKRAVSLAYRLMGNSEDAKDVAQDAFVRAYRSLSQLEDATRFGPWFLRVVSNLSLNFRRSRKSRAAGSLEDGDAVALNVRRPGSGKTLATTIEDEEGPLSAELQSAITKAMEQLPNQQRLALVLFSVEGMPQQEVAEILGCTVELVKWNVFQARKKLREMLGEFL